MDDLSLHILDIVENSTAAGATLIEISLTEEAAADCLEIRIKDNGRGMDERQAAAALFPFTTSRTTRRVGLGLPLFKMAAEETGGSLSLSSQPGVGTEVVATFRLGHIDCKPLGDLAATMLTLIVGNPGIDFVYLHTRDGATTELDTRELKAQLDGVPITTPAVLAMIRSHLDGCGDEPEGDDHG